MCTLELPMKDPPRKGKPPSKGHFFTQFPLIYPLRERTALDTMSVLKVCPLQRGFAVYISNNRRRHANS